MRSNPNIYIIRWRYIQQTCSKNQLRQMPEKPALKAQNPNTPKGTSKTM